MGASDPSKHKTITVNSYANINISFGENSSDIVQLLNNADFSIDSKASQEVYSVMGRKYPLQFTGENLNQSISVSGDIKFPNNIDEWYYLHENAKTVTLRIPYGFIALCSVDDISIRKDKGIGSANISLKLTRIDKKRDE